MEPQAIESGMIKMDCSFGHTCPEPYHPQPIANAQVGGHTLTAMVDIWYVQTLVHATSLLAMAGIPALGKMLACMNGRRKTYE